MIARLAKHDLVLEHRGVKSKTETPDVSKVRSGWRELLERWTLYCPACRERWLAMNVRDGENHICKKCYHSFTVTR